MTAPQPDTETLVEHMRRLLGPRPDWFDECHDALDAVDARLAETEAERDEARESESAWEYAAAEIERQAERRVATLEAALRQIESLYPKGEPAFNLAHAALEAQVQAAAGEDPQADREKV